MDQTMHLARSGWQPEEIEMLWQEIQSAAESGAPLRGVFERMGEALGRKPNSVRNYYYMQLRNQGGEKLQRAQPFEVFSEEDIHQLLRNVLSARGRGQSVRACVMELSGGDKALMLRYQNKYRSLLKKRPELIAQICRELESEGISVPDFPASRHAPSPVSDDSSPLPLNDPDAQMLLSALQSLLRRAQQQSEENANDRLKVQRDLLLMQLEDLQLASREMLHCCKEFLGGLPDQQMDELPLFCQSLAEQVARLESVSG
ncbi:MAG: hypothetical protein E7336_05425 [Clostridiales bacterium]|nr:hypothetical protein [Clostridiales bacterium]